MFKRHHYHADLVATQFLIRQELLRQLLLFEEANLVPLLASEALVMEPLHQLEAATRTTAAAVFFTNYQLLGSAVYQLLRWSHEELRAGIGAEAHLRAAQAKYLPLANGDWTYLCAFQDMASKQVVGWHVMVTMPEELITKALQRTFWAQPPTPGLLVHSNRGGQYCGNAYRKLLHDHEALRSQSRRGDCYDNAQAENRLKVFVPLVAPQNRSV